MIRAAALGLTLLLTVVLTGCGLLVAEEAPTDPIQVAAPPLVPLFPEVEVLAAAETRTLSVGRARRLVQGAAVRVSVPDCDDESKGRGFAVDARTLVAHRDVIEGGGDVHVGAGNRSTAVGAASTYRAGELVVARVARTLPQRLVPAARVAAGASVVAVAERNGKLRLLPGVVVDSVAGAPYGVRAQVLRLTSPVQDGDTGPVLDADGRVVGVVVAVDPQTLLGVAIPVAALRGRAVGRTLEALPAC